MKFEEIERNARLAYRLMRLNMACTVLHLGAHPDDEDVGLLAYLTCKHGVAAVYWSATRGEGGQNRIGPYREEALGVYRTWESLAAREVDGGECRFGPFYDFGYSKNAQETQAKWGGENLVREVVRAIRQVQPHIIVARWAGTPADFHGHHQAVGQASLDAWAAAGDPQQFPELKAQGLPAWQPLKFYHSMDNSGGDLSKGGAINVSGQLNPALERPGVLRLQYRGVRSHRRPDLPGAGLAGLQPPSHPGHGHGPGSRGFLLLFFFAQKPGPVPGAGKRYF